MNASMVAVVRSLPEPHGRALPGTLGTPLHCLSPMVILKLCSASMPCRSFLICRRWRTKCIEFSSLEGERLAMVLQGLERHVVFQALMESVARHLAVPISVVQVPFALCDHEELRTLFTAVGFADVEIRAESTVVRFPNAEKFVPFAVMSSAAAVPAFAQLNEPARRAMVEAIREEIEATLQAFRDGTCFELSDVCTCRGWRSSCLI